ncbi:MAG TPA: type IV-A pilus assembly ATPase PilB [Methylomirabilota bacterium]|jgi:type IV pilus assembly protein PilB
MAIVTQQERRELEEMASVFERILEANPLDVGALEGLRDLYGRLGDAVRLARATERLTAVTLGKASAASSTTADRERSAVTPRRRSWRLGELLVAEKVLSNEQLQDLLRQQRARGEKLGALLLRNKLLTEEQLSSILSRQFGIPAVSAAELNPAADVVALIPAHIARLHDVLPIRRTGDSLALAMADPTNVFALDDVAVLTSLRVMPFVAPQAALRAAVARLYPVADGIITGVESTEALEVVGDQEGEGSVDVFELKESADQPPVVKLVNSVLVDAITRGTSDIHFEPYERVFRIRFRVDGVLQEVVSPPKKLEAALISRLKIMSNLDIAERRLPQDGRIKLRYNRRDIDFRVSILPTIFGEKAVLRILDKEALKLDLSQLGFDPWSLENFEKAINQPYGMILITGPTGSGKTTTLYSAIHTINSPDVNIITAEDPVEYNLQGVNQVQIDEGIGRTFAAALRSFLRQDPDVILVGETRDLETAQIAIRAALTGHLVFTTLHTNDCPSTVARLIDMGVPSFLVASSMQLILAQRLARKLCAACREPYAVNDATLAPYGYASTGRGITLYRGRGCAACNGTGLKGRTAIYEVMPISPEIRDLILKGASTAALRAQAQEQGMRTLREAGLAKALAGETTVEEVLRVTLG